MTTSTRTQLHYTYAQLAGQTLTVLAIGLVVLVASVTSHYGNASTLNEGYAFGDDDTSLELGYETRGTPGLFGHLVTPLGTIGYVETITPAAAPAVVQVAADDVPQPVWDDMLAHGATSDPTDRCECLYAQVGSLYGPAGHQWTVTPDGAEPASTN